VTLRGNMPDITPAQIAAVLGWIVAQAVAFGWLDQGTGRILVSSGATIVAAAWKIADAYLRGQRARAVAQTPSLAQPPANHHEGAS
jgi:hypothetical protein